MEKIKDVDYRGNQLYTFQNLPGALIGALVFLFEGTNASGQTGTRANLGNCELLLNGKTIDQFSFERMWGVVDKCYADDYGKQQFSSSAGSTFATQIIRPLHLPGDNINALALQAGELSLKTSHDALTSVFDALTLTVYFKPRLGVNQYLLRFQNFSVNSKTANTAPDNFPYNNLALLHVDYSASLTQLLIQKDNKPLLNALTLAELQYYRSVFAGVRPGDAYAAADSAFNAFDFNFAKGGIDTALGQKYLARFGAASATVFTGMAGTVSFNSGKEAQSMANFDERITINQASR